MLSKRFESLGVIPVEMLHLINDHPKQFYDLFRTTFADELSYDYVSRIRKKFWNPSEKEIEVSHSYYEESFEEEHKVGEGGYGKVFLCKNKLDEQKYAVKQITIYDHEDKDNVLREVTTLSSLKHTNIVQYYQAWLEMSLGVGSSGSSTSAYNITPARASTNYSPKLVEILYIQMEYCPRTFEEFLRDRSGCLDERQCWIIFKQILEGLRYIHGKNIIHRDLARKNIFFDANGDIKIGDFGLCIFFTMFLFWFNFYDFLFYINCFSNKKYQTTRGKFKPWLIFNIIVSLILLYSFVCRSRDS